MEKSVTIFGVSLESQIKAEILKQFEVYLDGSEKKMVVTPNSEMLILARKNKKFRDVLNDAVIRLVDGSGPVYMVRLLYRVRLKRYAGVDAVGDIVTLAAQKNKKVFLLGGNEAVLEKLIAKWSREFPALQIISAVGPQIKLDEKNENGFFVDDTENKKTIQLIKDFSPDVLLVGFGHGKQELWLSAMLSQFSSVRLAMGVGGSFDYLSGFLPRAPLWMQKIGLEWLYRLMRQPRRIKRIFNAVIAFPLYAILDKIFV